MRREDGHDFKPKNTIPIVSSIVVWGCFSANGTGNISVIDARMNAAVYQNILEANLMISVENLELPLDWILDQKHAAKSTKKCFKENNANILAN